MFGWNLFGIASDGMGDLDCSGERYYNREHVRNAILRGSTELLSNPTSESNHPNLRYERVRRNQRQA